MLFLLSFLALNSFAANGPCYHLSNGEIGCEPFHVQAAEEVVLFGEGSLSGAADLLSPVGLKPVAVDGKALVGLDFLSYHQSDIGPYDEFSIMFLAQKPALDVDFLNFWTFLLKSASGPGEDPTYGFYFAHLVLDGSDEHAVETAILAGWETWGFPKYRGQLGFQMSSHDGFHLSVNSDLKLDIPLTLPLVLGSHTNMTNDTVTGALGKPCWVRSERHAFVYRPHSLGDDDHFAVDSQSKVGGFLSQLMFRAKNWVYSSGINAVLRNYGNPGGRCI
ncbi:MAG: acetoacetate decarboxylase family protein [Bdellovibrionota bacterium]